MACISQLIQQDILGSGKSAEVKKVEDPNTKSFYALKTFSDFQEWEREYSALQQLRHPHIIKQIEGRDNQILLEFCKNGELFDYVKGNGSFPEEIARFYFVQLLDAIYYIHAHGYIHGDIKLENILIDEDFNLKLADFGFAQKDFRRDDTTQVMGTDGYFAPEQLRREDHFGKPCDIFQLAITLFCMVSGTLPYPKEASEKDPFYKFVITRKITQFWNVIQKSTSKEYSPEFKDLINQMIQYKPSMRISIEEIREHKWVTSTQIPSPDEIKIFMSTLRDQMINNQCQMQTECI